MTQKPNPKYFVLAREARGMTQSDLAERIGVSQSKVSKFESELLPIGTDEAERAARVLGFPVALFSRDESLYAFDTTPFHYRKRARVLVGVQRRTHANLTLRRLELCALLRDIQIETASDFEPIDLDDFAGNMEDVAAAVRTRWSIPRGPIANLTEVVERNGGIVFPTDFGSDQIDAASQVSSGMPPVIFVNRSIPGDRLRWTLAHEIGHILLHREPTPNAELEADAFASALLLPRADALDDLCQPLDFGTLGVLKTRWRVSMQALVNRAHQLGTMSDRKRQLFYVQLSARGMRKREPVPIPSEQPTLLRELLKLHREEHQYSLAELATKVSLFEDEFRQIYLPETSHVRLLRDNGRAARDLDSENNRNKK